MNLVETPDATGAYPRLSEQQLAALERFGQQRRTAAAETLIREGDVDYDFYVVLEGHVAIVDESGPAPELIAVHGPRRFLAS
jgi:CRP-like cAMP-binding protein